MLYFFATKSNTNGLNFQIYCMIKVRPCTCIFLGCQSNLYQQRSQVQHKFRFKTQTKDHIRKPQPAIKPIHNCSISTASEEPIEETLINNLMRFQTLKSSIPFHDIQDSHPAQKIQTKRKVEDYHHRSPKA